MGEVINLVSDDGSDDDIPAASSSKPTLKDTKGSHTKRRSPEKMTGDSLEARDAIKVALAGLDAEIKSIEDQLRPLQELRTSLIAERRQLESQLSSVSQSTFTTNGKASKSTSAATIDYQSSSFDWSASVQAVLKSKFGLSSFRLCQEGVINAAIDSRDIVCVMPTGGGKSLTYQLPAIAGGKGLTVVISPLLALIWDQVRALKELDIECAMLTGSTSKEEQNDIYKRIEGSQGPDLRLVYVTPEKIAKSKRLKAAMEKANSAGRLKRFVIDEAHCCSQLGHDFRPDYRQLNVLKTLFPRVPIQAVTATLSSKTLPDLLKILRLPPISDGRAANRNGTVFFSAPLFRPNLHYKVLPKPSNAKTAIERIGMWITENHSNESGIIYCFSKKDAETVAESLRGWSEGGIKTGTYHAGIEDWEKESIHVKWRKGQINCICATIAFGLGIDKGDVRYVIHHSMSKSLEGYYQETGRAGRDGQNSDCVLFYRGQDGSRMSSMVYSDVDGIGKLQEMVKFAQDLKTCRKIAFARYFSASSHLSAAAWDHSDTLGSSSGGTVSTCGICDNCTRDPASIITKDVTLDAWRCLKVLNEVERNSGRITLSSLVDVVRGLGGGAYGVMQQGKGRKRKSAGEKATMDVKEVAEGKVELSKDDTETLLVYLSTIGYLKDAFSATAYSVNVYVESGDKSIRLTRLTKEQVESGLAQKIECTFPNPKAKAIKRKKTTQKATKKTLVQISEDDDGEDDEAAVDHERVDGDSDAEDLDGLDDIYGDDDFGQDEGEDEGWEVTTGKAGGWRPTKVTKGSGAKF